jgi:DMSO reductase family type II enzyme chaperone
MNAALQNSHHARSHFFALLAQAFRYPDEEQISLIREGALHKELAECLAQIAPDLPDELDISGLADAGTGDELQVEHTRLFELASSSKGCSLHMGVYRGPRMKAMEELVRYYNHFGLSLAEGQSELPDHITTQLEFLQFLTYCEAELVATGQGALDQRRARRDFVARYPARWLPILQERLLERRAMDFYLGLVDLLITVLEQDYQILAQELGEASLEAVSAELFYTEIQA